MITKLKKKEKIQSSCRRRSDRHQNRSAAGNPGCSQRFDFGSLSSSANGKLGDRYSDRIGLCWGKGPDSGAARNPDRSIRSGTVDSEHGEIDSNSAMPGTLCRLETRGQRRGTWFRMHEVIKILKRHRTSAQDFTCFPFAFTLPCPSPQTWAMGLVTKPSQSYEAQNAYRPWHVKASVHAKAET